MLDWTLQLLNHAWAPWAAAGFLLLWGGGHWLAMQGNFFRPLHRQLVEMRHELEETPDDPIAFAARYSAVSESLARHRLLTPTWTAFTRTITPPPQRGIPLHGTREPNQFFNPSALVGREAAQYYYSTIPNLLLGVGVLFTLIGLVAAIHLTIRSMASGDLYTTQTALMALLNAAAVKFLSSIAGFALALFFSWEEKRQKRRLERESEQICQLLLERMEWVLVTESNREQLQAAQTQSRQLQEIADRLHQVITQPTFQPQAGRAAESSFKEETAERLATQFEASMSQLRETVSALGETIKTLPMPDLQPILADMQQQGERLLQANELAMGRLVEGISRQFANLHTDATLAELSPDERSSLLDRLAGRMEVAMSNLEGATFAPLQNVAAQIERAVAAMEQRGTDAVPAGMGMEKLLEGLREEGTRILSAHVAASEKLLAGLSRAGRDGMEEGAPTALLERIATRLEEAVTALTARADGPSTVSATLLARMTERMEQAIDTLVGKAGSGLDDLAPLLERMQQNGERLLQANELAMERVLETVGRQIAGLQADATLAELRPEERTHVIERLSARMDLALANLGDAGLSPFHRIAGQLEKAIATLDDRVAQVGPATDMTPLIVALREEGKRMQAAHVDMVTTLRSELAHRGGVERAAGAARGAEELPALLDRLGLQLENAIFALGEKIDGSAVAAGGGMGLEGVLRAVRLEGAQLVRANEEAMQRVVEMVDRRLTDATATATLSELHPAEREGLLERVAVRMEQAVASLGEVGLSPFFDSIRREVEQIPGVGQEGLNNEMRSTFARITQQLDSVTAALESKVWAADTVPDLTPLVQAVRSEGERLLRANEQTLDRLFTELTQRSGGVGFSRSAGALPDLESLFERIAREGERLVQANEASMAGLLSEVARRFAGVSATTALAELRPTERSELLEGVAARMERAVAGLGELGLAPLVDGMRHEIGQLVKSNQQAVGQLLEEISQRSREKGAQETQLLESVVAQVGQAITRMGERFASSLPGGSATLLSEEIVQAVRQEGERLQESQQRLFGKLDALLSGMGSSLPGAAAAPAGEVVAVLDGQSIQPLLDGWRQEGERLVQANEAAFARLLEEVGEQFAQLRGGGEVAVLEELSSRLHHSIQAVGEPSGELAEVDQENQEALRPVLAEMSRIMSRQRRAEERLLQQVVEQVNRSVAALDAKIGRATPLNLKTLTHTVQEQGDRLLASVQALAPTLAEVTQSIARQRGEEMRLLERVAAEVNRSVAALDARIGRASPLQLQTLVHTVKEQGAEIVHALRGTRGDRVATQVARAAEPVSTEVARPTSRSGEAALPAGRAGLHALLAGLPTHPAGSPAVAQEPDFVASAVEPVAAPEAGLLVAYHSPFVTAAAVQSASSSWVVAKVEESVAATTGGAGASRPRGEGKVPLVSVAGVGRSRTGAGDLKVGQGEQHPWVPAVVKEFDARRGRQKEPFTVFVAKQTADSLQSQERFSLFR
ncbi:MAG: hypothetical protein H7836_06510 [Magnetococcus sp. YQC-3]